MRKIFRTGLLLLVPYFLCGCASFMSWEGWSAASTKVVVINNTQDIDFDISVNDRQVTKSDSDMVRPGERRSVLLPNFHEGTDREYLVLVRGWDRAGNVIGVTERVYNVESYKQGCKPWIIESHSFRMRK